MEDILEAPDIPPKPSNGPINPLVQNSNKIIQALAVNSNNYGSDEFYWNGNLVTEHSSYNICGASKDDQY